MLPENSANPRKIALVDCNNFYVSCERVFRPQWENLPVGVLSNNDGCLISRSNELKEAGIPMAAPYFQVQDKLGSMGAIIVSSNYTLYGEMSARVMTVLSSFVPSIEIYSIDEAWLELTGLNYNLEHYTQKIARVTKQSTGIPVSVGIGCTKVLAKLANHICKQYKISGSVYDISSAQNIDAILKSIPVSKVWGVGFRWAEQLRKQNIYTARDLKRADPIRIKKTFNVVMQRIVMELRGISCLDFEEESAKKSITSSRSFGRRIEEKGCLIEAAAFHATRAGEKLRQQGSVCSLMQVSIRSGKHHPSKPFFGNSSFTYFETPTADTKKLIRSARKSIDKIFKPDIRYAKVGVSLLDISSEQGAQVSLFEDLDPPKTKILMEAIDSLNKMYGRSTIHFATEGMKKTWLMRANHKTPNYTTSWQDIPLIR